MIVKANEIIDFHTAVLPEFEKEWAEAKENINLCFGDHWTEEEIRKHIAKGRIPLNIPMLYNKVLTLAGIEKTNRNVFIAEPVGIEDELTAHIINVIFRHIERNNKPKYEYIKSDIFLDGIVACYGVLKINRIESPTGEPEIQLEHIPYNNVIFDRNFKSIDMEKCSRIQHFEWIYEDDLKAQYPNIDFSKVEEDLSDSSTYSIQPIKNFYIQSDGKKKIIKVIHDYKKIYTTVYQVIGIKSGEVFQFDTRQEAEEFITHKNIQGEIIESVAQNIIEQPFEKEEYEIKEKIIKKILYTCIAGTQTIVDTYELNRDSFPIKIFFSIFHQGKFFTPVSIGKHLQKYFDRLFSQLDYSIGTDTKTSFQLDVSKLKDMTPEEAKSVITQGGVITTIDSTPVTIPIQKAGANPQYFTVLQIIQSITEDTFGGRNIQGIEERSGQSGIAIQRLQQSALGMTFNFIDNLNRFEEQVGNYLLQEIKDIYSEKRVLKILGKDLTEKVRNILAENGMFEESLTEAGFGYLKVPTENFSIKVGDKIINQNSISDAGLIVNLTKKSIRILESDIKFAKYIQVAQVTGIPIPAELWKEALELNPVEFKLFMGEWKKKEQFEQMLAIEKARQQEIKTTAQVMRTAGSQLNEMENKKQ